MPRLARLTRVHRVLAERFSDLHAHMTEPPPSSRPPPADAPRHVRHHRAVPPRTPRRTTASWSCFELSGGNDGLNTVVPYADDAYYRLRPTIGIRPNKLRKLDDHFGLNPGMVGFERLYKDGKLAIVHGCGYDNPSFSHFTSMAYWHTAAPNSGDEYGWVGRLADTMAPAAGAELPGQHRRQRNRSRCAAACTRRWYSTIPTRFVRKRVLPGASRCSTTSRSEAQDNPSRRYLSNRWRVSAREASVAGARCLVEVQVARSTTASCRSA